MKSILHIILLMLFSFAAYAQQKTKITGYISDLNHDTALVELQIIYPYDPIKDNLQQIQREDIITNDGRFELTIEIDKPVFFSGFINKKWILLPGAMAISIFPGDSIHMNIIDSNSPNKYNPETRGIGITEISFSGKGSERIDFHKSIMQKVLSSNSNIRPKESATLSERMIYADNVLNIVDSSYTNYKGKLSNYEKKLVRAQIYEQSLDIIAEFAMINQNDSIPFLCDKYIFTKNRLAPFFEDDIIFYSGGSSVVGYFLIIKELGIPYKFGGSSYRSLHPINYLNILVKHLKGEPQTRNYLLTEGVKTIFGRQLNSIETEEAIRIYKENVSSDYILFNKIMELYSNSISKLKLGKPFFAFELPDTEGKIHKLDDFKGKLLVLDFYFNGCGGCKAMVPYIEQAETELIDLPIQFISVSIDRTKDAWFEGIGKYCSEKSLHLYTEGLAQRHPLVEFLRVIGYPFLVVVDKNGNIIGTPPDPRTNIEAFNIFIRQLI